MAADKLEKRKLKEGEKSQKYIYVLSLKDECGCSKVGFCAFVAPVLCDFLSLFKKLNVLSFETY